MKRYGKVCGVVGWFAYFLFVFCGTFVGLWYFKKYKAIVYVHIISPNEHSFARFPQFAKFYNKYKKKFDMVVRNESIFISLTSRL